MDSILKTDYNSLRQNKNSGPNVMQLIKRLVDISNPKSMAFAWRSKRFRYFEELLKRNPTQNKILDVGGSSLIWEQMGFHNHQRYEITIANLSIPATKQSNFLYIVCDATNMSELADQSFDFVYSNSVIEHVGDRKARRAVVEEIRRVARHFYLQTPNKFFPIEPHFLFPFYQFLPTWLQTLLIRFFNLGHMPKASSWSQATAAVASVELMTLSELRDLFPNEVIIREKVCGMTKSFIVIGDSF